MSRRTALWFAMVGWLATTVIGPAKAQDTPAVAPEPHLKLNISALGPLGSGLDPNLLNRGPFDRGQTFSLSVGLFESMLDEAPMPRAIPARDWLVELRETGTGSFLIGAGQELRVVAPAPPHCAFDRCPVPVATGSEVMNLTWTYSGPSKDVVRPAGRFPHPLAGVTSVRWDEAAGGWWVETMRMPLSRPTARPVVLPACCDEKPAVGGRQDCGHDAATLAARLEYATRAEKTNKLAGTWYRDLDVMVVSATFTGDELKLCLTQSDEGLLVCFTITADYALTKEGVVHGVITGADVNVKSDPKAGDKSSLTKEILEGSQKLQVLVDCPFSFRVKQTTAGAMVSGFKIATEVGVGHDELALICGMFQRSADGKVPVAKPMKTASAAPECRKAEVVATTAADAVPPMTPPTPPGEVRVMAPPLADPGLAPPPAPGGGFGGMTPPSPRYLQHFPQYFPPDPNHPLPRELANMEDPEGAARRAGRLSAGMTPTLTPPQPANVPPGEFGMMADVFGQMMAVQAGGRCDAAPPVVVVSQPMTCPVQPAALSQPAPRMLVVAPQVAAMPARPLTGTWVREVGPSVYVIKIAGDHITMTVTGAAEFDDGKVSTEGMTITADYHLMRDGTTLLGLVTGVDAILEGDLPATSDLMEMGGALEQLQKALTDKPLAMNLRLYGDTLVIGNVRVADDRTMDSQSPVTSFGGRYRNIGDRATPKPKAVKLSDLQKAAPPPGPIYGPPVGTYGPPPFADCPVPFANGPVLLPPPLPGPSRAPGFPPPYAIPAQPVSGPVIAAGPYVPQPVPSDHIPPPTPRVNETPPPPPVPTMAPPTPPVIEQPKERKKGKKKKKPDAPSHLTPERIHGGILMP